MRIIFNILLAFSILGATSSYAGDEEIDSYAKDNSWFRTTKFLIVPADQAKQAQCTSKNLTLYEYISDLNRKAKPQPGYRFRGTAFIDYPTISFPAASMGTIDDDELLCYRCSFKKMNQEDCGTYKNSYGNESWAKNCPSTKK